MKKAWLGILLLPLGAVTCKADFKFGCEDGNCAAASSATVGAGGGCLAIPSDPDKHGFPDDVYAVLQKNCWGCHGDPPTNNAPHPFFHYEDTQDLYTPEACATCAVGDTTCQATLCQTWAPQMRLHAIQDPAKLAMGDPDGRSTPKMPFMKDPIPLCEQAILSAWLDTCGADPTVPDLCMKGAGMLSGNGGAGGMGTTSNSSSSASTSTATSSTATGG